MASSFTMVVQPGSPQPRIVQRTVDPAATFPRGSLVYLDTADNLIKLCGADPAAILGLAMSSAADAIAGNHGEQAGLINVAVIESDQVWMMGSATTPANANTSREYGIVNTSNVWLVDTTDTTNKRVVVTDYSPKTGQLGKECYFVHFMPAALQDDGVVS